MTIQEIASWGFEMDAAAHQRLAAFVEALLDENTRVNLTAIRNPPDTWALHVCDSLALAAMLGESGAASLVDIGSGGGAPAIPIACVAPQMRIVAIDRVGKKVDAIRRICDRVGLTNVKAYHGRAEDLAHQPGLREQFDAVTARAVAPLPTVLEYAAGF
ncbi:MAG: 16S rRNA (guanine(527)-N(7))-methyltransferase RsmG, partial [Phycisphaerales bacterium]|nr:16S rRNA (guanine(527)-N(7))-methyltransferase RsmG [Phycisphaerales bacterium]